MYCGGPPTAIDSILATIADGGQGIVDIDREVGRNKLITKPFDGGLGQPLGRVTLALDQSDLLNPCCQRGQRLHRVDDV